jgi:hypothetical protein
MMPYQSCQKLAVSHWRPKMNAVIPVVEVALHHRERRQVIPRQRLKTLQPLLQLRRRQHRHLVQDQGELVGKRVIGLLEGRERAAQSLELGGKVNRDNPHRLRLGRLALGQQLPPLLLLVLVDDKLGLDRHRHLGEGGQQAANRIDGVAKLRGKIVEWREGGRRRLLGEPLLLQVMLQHPQPKVGEIARQRGVAFGFLADEINVLQPSLAINRETLAILPEEPRALAEEKIGDQCEDHDRHDRIAPEENPDAVIDRQAEESHLPLLDDEARGLRREVRLTHGGTYLIGTNPIFSAMFCPTAPSVKSMNLAASPEGSPFV